jgi:hypothetical protein
MKHTWIKGLAIFTFCTLATASFAAEHEGHSLDYRTLNAGGDIG